MKIAIEGCCHGELDKIYETISYIEQQEGIKVDLLIICGDFQAVRNRSDLQAMAVPPKFQQMNTFWKYYKGEKKAPLLTIFIGGNHEASNYLQELPYGGWVAPNIYYLGYAGVVNVGGVRIAGLSGIYKAQDYNKGHYEHPPYSEGTKRSAYHIRNIEVFRLKQIKKPVDIFISHDWPRSVYRYGNCEALLKRKPFFRDEVASDSLGNPAAEDILFTLKPSYWFSAHLHVKFTALIEHKDENGESRTTKFLALDKCLPFRQFLQVIDVPHDAQKPTALELDSEWLTILKLTNHLLCLQKSMTYMPGPGSGERWNFSPTEAEIEEVLVDFGGLFKVPENFTQTVPVHDDIKSSSIAPTPQIVINPQTTLLCEMLGLLDPLAVFSGGQAPQGALGMPDDNDSGNTSEEDEDEGVDSDFICTPNTSYTPLMSHNPDEISLDEFDPPPPMDSLEQDHLDQDSLDQDRLDQDRLSPPEDLYQPLQNELHEPFDDNLQQPQSEECNNLSTLHKNESIEVHKENANDNKNITDYAKPSLYVSKQKSVAQRLKDSFASISAAKDLSNISEHVSQFVDSSAVATAGLAVNLAADIKSECNVSTTSQFETTTTVTQSVTVPTTTPSGRVLKRRNQSLYAHDNCPSD